MLTSIDTEFQRRLEKAMDEEFRDRVEKMVFHSPVDNLGDTAFRKGELRMLRYIGQLCQKIAQEMGSQ